MVHTDLPLEYPQLEKYIYSTSLSTSIIKNFIRVDDHVVFNSLRSSHDIWRYRSESTLAQVMTSCSHYVDQWWEQFHKKYLWTWSGDYTFEIDTTSPRRQWVNAYLCWDVTDTVYLTCTWLCGSARAWFMVQVLSAHDISFRFFLLILQYAIRN